jgi:hypothetical protein
MKGENILILALITGLAFFFNDRFSKLVFIVEMTFAQKEFMTQIITPDTTSIYDQRL